VTVEKIPKVEIPSIGITPINTYVVNPPQINAPNVPVNVPIGFPIIEMPCVKTRKSPLENDALIDNDPDGNVILCPAGVPAFEPMNYDPLQIVPVKEESQQRYEDPEIPPAAEVPEAKPETCPPDGAAKVGTKVEEGKREIIKYELVGNRCVTRYKELTIKQQIVDAIPTVPQVIKTGSITLVATTAALSTPILLRAIKPIIQQIVKRVKKILGKEEKALSLSQKRTNAYREKKGLPPLKVKK
tara:strand:+ start:196 stop:924 length:729 start_codon:yes stop_codon:yes gene_type:complete